MSRTKFFMMVIILGILFAMPFMPIVMAPVVVVSFFSIAGLIYSVQNNRKTRNDQIRQRCAQIKAQRK